MGSIGHKHPSHHVFFSPTSRGKFLDLRPALERARRAAYDRRRRFFCERTPTVNVNENKKGEKKLSEFFFSPSGDTVGDMHKRPQLPNQTPRGAQWTFLGNLPGGSFRIWPRSLYFSICVRLIFSTFHPESRASCTWVFSLRYDPVIFGFTRDSVVYPE